MVRRLTLLAWLLLPGVALAQEAARPRPKPPLELGAPAAPAETWDDEPITGLDPDVLRENAWQAYQEQRWAVAAQFQHWAVHKDGDGRYNLACFHARAGARDAAFYWLQQAALEEGVDGVWAGQDADLESLRQDPRWGEVASWLVEVARWWGESGRRETLLVLPAGYQPGSPLGALVGLHGRGSHPQDFADAKEYQALADQLGLAFVGVSGTRPIGPRSFVWAEDPVADLARIQAALDEVAGRVRLDPGRTVLLGFSQGAQTALELAARHPDRFAGAIALSPGAQAGSQLEQVAPDPRLAQRGFVIVVGAGEPEASRTLARRDGERLRGLGARVEQRETQGQDEHAFPSDFPVKLGEWHAFAVGRP